VILGKSLANEYGLFEHVTRDHEFSDGKLFYRFLDGQRGKRKMDDGTGERLGWQHFLSPVPQVDSGLQPIFPVADLEGVDGRDEHVGAHVWPLDKYNIETLNHVHPPDWVDPAPKKEGSADFYDMVVIGGGTAGLITSGGFGGLGARVALIEEHFLGGDCLNVGCVPSKSIIHSASLVQKLRRDAEHLAENGITIEGGPSAIKVDFGKVMERVRRIRSVISHHDSAERYSKDLGVEIFIGRAKFLSERSVIVNGRTLEFKRAVICTGGYPSLIPLPGLKELYDLGINPGDQPRPAVMTNETFFNLTTQPKHMVVVGAGVIGLELAQSLQRLGSSVTVFARSGKILPKEDEDMALLVQKQMEDDGVTFRLSVQKYISIELTGNVDEENGLPEMKITITENGSNTDLVCDALLIATGRRPNVTGMDLEKAKVKYDDKTGIIINDKFQTSNSRVFSAGDCCSQYKFTHAADFMARAVIRNALFFGKEKHSALLVPYATFTAPEIASVGLYGSDLDKKGIKYRVFEKHFKDNDRSICDSDTVGLIRYRVDAKSDKILGASIVGTGAGNMIGEVTLAMQSGTGLSQMASVIHPYPTKSEVLRQAGDLFNKTKLTPSSKKLLRGLIKAQR